MFLLGQSQVGIMATEDGVWMQKASCEPAPQGRLVRLMYLWLSWHLLEPPLHQGEETVLGDSKGLPLALCPDLPSTSFDFTSESCCTLVPSVPQKQEGRFQLAAAEEQGIEGRWLHKKELKRTGK